MPGPATGAVAGCGGDLQARGGAGARVGRRAWVVEQGSVARPVRPAARRRDAGGGQGRLLPRAAGMPGSRIQQRPAPRFRLPPRLSTAAAPARSSSSAAAGKLAAVGEAELGDGGSSTPGRARSSSRSMSSRAMPVQSSIATPGRRSTAAACSAGRLRHAARSAPRQPGRETGPAPRAAGPGARGPSGRRSRSGWDPNTQSTHACQGLPVSCVSAPPSQPGDLLTRVPPDPGQRLGRDERQPVAVAPHGGVHVADPALAGADDPVAEHVNPHRERQAAGRSRRALRLSRGRAPGEWHRGGIGRGGGPGGRRAPAAARPAAGRQAPRLRLGRPHRHWRAGLRGQVLMSSGRTRGQVSGTGGPPDPPVVLLGPCASPSRRSCAMDEDNADTVLHRTVQLGDVPRSRRRAVLGW